MHRAMTMQRAMSANELGQPAPPRPLMPATVGNALRDARPATRRSAMVIALCSVIALYIESTTPSSPQHLASASRLARSLTIEHVLHDVRLGISSSSSSSSRRTSD